MSDLQQFVLEYVDEAGGIVEPAAPGVYEVLLPQELAERWRVPSYLQVAFDDRAPAEAVRLGYNHPLVEQMVAAARSRPASARLFIPGVRLAKSNLIETAMKEWRVMNARVVPPKRGANARVRSSYVRFNFKVEILSDEKQERLISALMDAHSGYRAIDPATVEARATSLEPDDLLPSLPEAPVRWAPAGAPALDKPLEERALDALLERAKRSVRQELAADLEKLQKRAARFRQLDEARLEAYYQELEGDLAQRLTTASAERRPGLEEKLAAVRTEREQKLADVAERYRVRVNLTLLNVLVIQQPKLVTPATIENRTTAIDVYAVWDPLLHRLEPLACQVCGGPGQRLYLCHNGHLAHQRCLAPACVDCKRVFCELCSGDVGACAVCNGPLCRHSRIICGKCGRGTCQEHQGLCHAADGEPVDLAATVDAAPPAEREDAAPAPARPRDKKPAPGKSRTASPGRRAPAKGKRPASRTQGPRARRIEVIAHPTSVFAYVLGAKEKTIAFRVWELIPGEGGIVRTCECEKGSACQATHVVLRPPEAKRLEPFMLKEIGALRQEYGLPADRVHFNRVSSLSGEPLPWPQLDLFGLWTDEEALEEARATFSRLHWA